MTKKFKKKPGFFFRLHKYITEERLRNKLYRRLGIFCFDDFNLYADDVMNVLEAFELFTKRTAKFSTIVASRLDINDLNEEIEKMNELPTQKKTS